MKGLILMLTMGLCSVLADDVCTEISKTSSEAAKMVSAQIIEGEFIVDIEVVKKESNIVQNMKMYYSKRKNIIRLDILTNGAAKTSLYFYFNQNEMLDMSRSPADGQGGCKVFQDIGKYMSDFWFGGIQRTGKNEKTPAPLAALHFAGLSGFSNRNIKQNYLGRTDVRGKSSTIYTSCQKWRASGDEIVLNVTHYFSDEKYKFPYTDSKYSTLLSMEVSGTGTINGKANVKIDHLYNYFNFRGFEEGDTRLEQPDGIVCKGRKPIDGHKFPDLPKYMKFSGEVVARGSKKYVAKEEVYDYYHKYAIIKTIDRLDSKTDMNKMTTLYDFELNRVMYVDEVETSCQSVNITAQPKTLDLFTIQKGQAVMQGPKAFFMADPKDFVYIGQQKVRGMMTEVWVAPSSVKKGAIVQFYFAPPVESWNDDVPSLLTSKWPVPVKVKVWSTQWDKNPQTENIYHVDYNPLRSDYIDLSPCFPYSYHMQIVVKGTRADVVNSYQELFFYQTKSQLAQTARTTFNQINQMRVNYANNNIYLEFVIGAHDKTKVADAVQRITKDLNSGDLVLKTRTPGTKDWTKVLSLVRVGNLDAVAAKAKIIAAPAKGNSDSGYTKGAMAGLGFAMVVVGLAGGAGAGFAHGKYFG